MESTNKSIRRFLIDHVVNNGYLLITDHTDKKGEKTNWRAMDFKELENISNKKYPKRVDNKEPVKTPIFTPSIYSKLFAKAKFPTNKLIVKPMPVNIDTAYKAGHVEPVGLSANLSFIEI